MQCTCLNFQDFREEADLEKKIAFKNVAWNEQKKKKKTELASIYNTPIIFFVSILQRNSQIIFAEFLSSVSNFEAG